MRIIITGGSGFIGTNVVAQLRHEHTILNIDKVAPRQQQDIDLWEQIDINDHARLRTAVLKFSPQAVIHLAARTDLSGNTVAEYSSNTNGVRSLVGALAGLPDLGKVVFASSRLVCKIGYEPRSDSDYCPTTAYGESKAIGEGIVRSECRSAQYEWAIVRPTSIWGPWFDVPYRTFFNAVRSGHFFMPAGATVRKSFGYVGNSVHALHKLVHSKLSQQTLYLADYEAVDIWNMAVEISRHFGKPPKSLPMSVLRAAAIGGDLLKAIGVKEPPLTSFRLANMLTPMIHDTTPLEALVGPLPFDMHTGVEETVNWMNQHG